MRKGSPQDRALKAGIEQSFALSALLNSIAKALTENDGTVDPKVASRWLAKAEFIANEIDEIKANALDDTQPLLIGGSILRDAEKITEILSD